MNKTLIALAIAAISTQAGAWGNSHTHNYPFNYNSGNASTSASQGAVGGNNVSAFSASAGNGSAYNTAGSSMYVSGAARADTGTTRINDPKVGRVSGYQYNASAQDTKTVNTWAVSNNQGNAIGTANSSASAFGKLDVSGSANDAHKHGVKHVHYIGCGHSRSYTKYSFDDAAYAGSEASGWAMNGVSAGSNTGTGNGGNGLYANGSTAMSQVDIDGYAAAGHNNNGAVAVAYDNKVIDTQSASWAQKYNPQTDTFQNAATSPSDGHTNGYSLGGAYGDVDGSVYESSWD